MQTAPSYTNTDQYPEFLHVVRTALANVEGPLFTTDAAGLFEAFLKALPAQHQQHYNCRSCQHFIERFGGLVLINEKGVATPAAWCREMTPPFFLPSVEAVLRIVRAARVTGVFLTKERVLGQPETPSVKGLWHHLHGVLPTNMVFKHAVLSASQAAAAKLEDHNTVAYALAMYTPELVKEALRVLNSDALYRAEHVLGQAVWLDKLHTSCGRLKGWARDNILWREIATAPAGFCHPRSSMIGTLLDDLAAGMPFEAVSKRFAEKMHPLQYQRPQAAPTAGAIEAAEKLVEKMGIRPSFARRFARLEEVPTIWRPKAPQKREQPQGMFQHLKPKGAVPNKVEIPAITMTWEKFSKTVLPTAEQIELELSTQADGYGALLTAAHPEAPPIIQWDYEDERNPFSWYVYGNGSFPTNWGLPSTGFVPVTGISRSPAQWGSRPIAHHGEHVMFILQGAVDQKKGSGSALFPEFMRTELHGVRSVIEAYSRTVDPEGREEASACGLIFGKQKLFNRYFRVTQQGVVQKYLLDRWD